VTQYRELRQGEGYLGSNDTRMLIYLPGGRADELEIIWPGGASTLLLEVGPGDLLIDETYGLRARRER